MTKSLWRASHLLLALISCIFLVITSLTGLVLSFEPIYNINKVSATTETEDLTISSLLDQVSDQYDEIQSISRNPQGALLITAFHENKNQKFFIDPITGKKIGGIYKTPKIFDFCRNLHRSLFLKKIGRFLIGLCSVLLIISSITGILLVIKKQGGFKGIFSKIVKNEFHKDAHTELGRAFLIPILIIGITGTILFLERFSFLPEFKVSHEINFELLNESPQLKFESFKVLNKYNIGNLKELTFPFSTVIEEYFELKLNDRELLFNQRNGEVLSEVIYPSSKNLSILSFTLHTGETSFWWAIILGLSSLSILYFNFSGIKIFLKEKNPKKNNPFPIEECSIVILVGSEHGGTFRFAQSVQNSFLNDGKKAYLTEMNEVKNYNKLTHLLILTSTYGNGEAPSNADKFLKKIAKNAISDKPFFYSVLGFGSKAYPNFCQFAYEVDHALKNHLFANELLNINTVNENYFVSFKEWLKKLEIKINTEFNISEEEVIINKIKPSTFKVIRKQYSENSEDATFLLELSHKNGHLKKYHSGDLIGIFPDNNTNERFYSIGFNEKNKSLLLSIKIHQKGICSNYLNNLNPDDKISAYLKSNKNFHVPKKAKKVIMIANGTGIAPFLGMITNNLSYKEYYLFWGGQNNLSYQIYAPIVNKAIKEGKVKNIFIAYSRIKENKEYVQDALMREKELVEQLLNKNCTIMICGSLKMKDEVMKSLNIICQHQLGISIDQLEENDLIKSDCY